MSTQAQGQTPAVPQTAQNATAATVQAPPGIPKPVQHQRDGKANPRNSGPMDKAKALNVQQELISGLQNDQERLPVVVFIREREIAASLYPLYLRYFQVFSSKLRGSQLIGAAINGNIPFDPRFAAKCIIIQIIQTMRAQVHNTELYHHFEIMSPIYGVNKITNPLENVGTIDPFAKLLVDAMYPIVLRSGDRLFKYIQVKPRNAPDYGNDGAALFLYLFPQGVYQDSVAPLDTMDTALFFNYSRFLTNERTAAEAQYDSTVKFGKVWTLFDSMLYNQVERIASPFAKNENFNEAEELFAAIVGTALTSTLAYTETSDWYITNDGTDVTNYGYERLAAFQDTNAAAGIPISVFLNSLFQRSHYVEKSVIVKQGSALCHNFPARDEATLAYEGGRSQDAQVFKFVNRHFYKVIDTRLALSNRITLFLRITSHD